MIYFLTSFMKQSITERDIRVTEINIKREIPAEYRAFLLQRYADYPLPRDFTRTTSMGRLSRDSVSKFIGLNTSYDIEWYLQEYAGRMPHEMFPVAIVGGCLICISSDGENKGKVFFWDSEEEEPDPVTQPNYDNITLLAHSFNEFLDMLE